MQSKVDEAKEEIFMIFFQEVTKIFPSNILALENVSFEIKPKEFVSIAGKSGAGKTTLLRILLAEEKPTKGQIFLDGENLSKIEPAHLPQLRRKIGAVFQDYKLLPSKTTYENIAYSFNSVASQG